MGGSETFDSLTDLVEHFKKTGIEEASGAFVYLRQVKGGPGCLLLSPEQPPGHMSFWELNLLTLALSHPSHTTPRG